jgi:hypothetical protein
MIKQAHNLAKIAESAYAQGFKSEAKQLFFTALKLAHVDNPLVKVLNEYGFEPSEIFEYGNDGVLDEVHPSEKSVHRKDGNEVQEVWLHVGPDGLEYGYMHDDGDYGHQHKYFDNLEDLLAHISEEQEIPEKRSHSHGVGFDYVDPDREEKEIHSCEEGGSCTCGGACKTASSKKKKNVRLNKPFRTPGGPKKFSVYVKNNKGNIVKVNFGDPNMEIKRDDPGRRKNFRARHHCETAKDPTKARTWSCRMWQRGKSVSQMTKGK